MKKNYSKVFLCLFCIFLISEIGLAQPCAGTPGTNTATTAQTIVCPGSVATLSLVNTYSVSGLTYQWYSSTFSSVGPFSIILGANQSTYTTTPLTTSTFFYCKITCTNGNLSTSSTFVNIQVLPALTTSTVPYYEGFEGITYTNQLPNCSWLAPNLGTTFNTYTISQPGNLVPCSGSKYCAFSLPSSDNMVYTNGIQMYPGITYSASVYYKTEYIGYTNWTQLALLVGANQNTTGLAQITATSPAVSGPCKLLGGTFTVSSAGIYYIAIKANAISGSALYLSLDDLSVVIPCSGTNNTPTITVSPNNISVCEGSLITFTATGADSYLWSNGATGSVCTITFSAGTGYAVTGTNIISGCSANKIISIGVNPAPTVFALTSSPVICLGDSAILSFYGGSVYSLTSGPVTGTIVTGSSIVISPTVTTCYTVTGANTFSCSAKTSVCIQVRPLPVVTATYSPTNVCIGEQVVLIASGASVYQWNGFAPGNSVTAYPTSSMIYMVTGTDLNGCKNTATLSVLADPCTGFSNNQSGEKIFYLFPNPNSDMLTIKSSQKVAYTITIIDALGRIILKEEITESKFSLDLNKYPRGLYYAKMESGKNSEVIKFIKQ